MKIPEPLHSFPYDVCLIGGCGRVGAPLGILFASKGCKVAGYDIDAKRVDAMNAGRMVFSEPGSQELLSGACAKGNICFSHDPAVLGQAKFLIVCIGTPVDEHGNPQFRVIDELIALLKIHSREENQIIIVRSSVYPGTTEYIQRALGSTSSIAFCPERIAEGFALKEYRELPQIVASPHKDTRTMVAGLFSKINDDVYEMDSFEEAEFVKMITNSFRYINFAIANQFFMIAERHGLNFDRIYQAATYHYPRMQGFINKGFVGGTCLYKDTMQLNAFHSNYFTLGQSAIFINEGLPDFIVEQLKKRFGDLRDKTVGILGMTYKADIDDVRESLSFKLKKLLTFASLHVKWHDPYLEQDPACSSLNEALGCDIVVLATPHTYYKERADQLRKATRLYNATYWQIPLPKVLVCGSEGSLMQAVIPQFLADGYEVVGVDNFFRYGEIQKERPYAFIQGDLCDREFVNQIFRDHKIDYVIQGAARIFGVKGFHKYPADILAYDTLLHKNILWASVAHRVKRVVYLSSSMVYERATTVPSREEDVREMQIPLTDYGLSKLTGERLSMAFSTQYKLPYTIWRPFNIITPFERAEDEPGIAHVFADLIDKILIKRQNPVEIFGDGEQVRSFTWIYEVAEAMAKYSFDPRTECKIFNLGQYNVEGKAEGITINQLAKTIFEKGKYCGIIPQDEILAIRYTQDPLIRETDVRMRIPDASRAHETFGWNTKVNTHAALDICIRQIIKDGLCQILSPQHVQVL